MTTYTPRERVFTAFNHREPDRVPLACGCSGSGITDQVADRLRQRLGITGKPVHWRRGHGDTIYDPELMKALNSDIRHVFLMDPVIVNQGVLWDENGNFTDEWGIYIKKTPLYYDWASHPLEHATIGDLRSYPWPNPYSSKDYIHGLREMALAYQREGHYAIATRSPGRGIFELAIQLRGFEKFLMDMAIDPSFAERLIGEIGDTVMAYYDVLLEEVGDLVDIVETQDDLAHQQSLFMSPAYFRKFFKNTKKELNLLIKRKAPKARIYHHSCGAVAPLIRDLIEIGVDILNPVQPLASGMEPTVLKQEFGKEIIFLGAIDLQYALSGPAELVDREVRKRIRDLAPGGGYILAPSNVIQADVPIENVTLLYQLGERYGKYPLNFDTSDL
jgi:uroporphyrinogen decarboxylase